MNITFTEKTLDEAPSTHTRIRLTEDEVSLRRFVREGEVEFLEMGTGKRDEMTRRKFTLLCRRIVRTAQANKLPRIALHMSLSPFPQLNDIPLPELGSLIAQNLEMANFEFNQFKTKKDGTAVEEVLICGETPEEMQGGFARGQIIAQEVNACRTLANTPGGSLTPRGLADAAKAAVEGLQNVSVKTLGMKEIEAEGMGLLAGVGRGSSNEPTFTILDYKGADEAPIVLVGKGITFDSGGLNLKSSPHIYEMHMDMSGAAAVIHAVALAAKLGVKKHVIGLIPAAENMPGQNATRPGDILKSLSGKTVEVTDTDAEGRLVLADAITYAKRFEPSVVLDAATLTGAAISALGLYASGLMTRDDALATQLTELGESSGDYVWRLPLWEEYEGVTKSDFADLVNYPTSKALAYGGATGGGIFLLEFAKELSCPWAHLDIAPRMTSAPGDELAKGAAGEPVRLFLSFIESWTNPT